MSDRVRALDGDFAHLYGPTWPRRTAESMISSVYQYEVQSGLILQPNFQFIHHPGGGATDPFGITPGKKLKDATVFGLRTVLKF